MKRPALLAALGAAVLALAACGDRAARDEAAGKAGASEADGANETTIHADMNGMRANIDFDGGDVRIGGNGVSVNVNGGKIEARVRTNEDGSVSITTNSQ